MITPIDQIFEATTEGYSDLMEMVENIPLLSWMISKDRPRVKDMPKDNEGKVIVNVAQPHILESMSYFTKAAQVFTETGKYCPYYPSKSKDSPYRKFWDEEIKRCKEGYVREDGEWVTGYYYYYLNYTKIWKDVAVGETTEDGLTKSDRVEDFPDIWDGDYLFFHYCDQAENKGKYGTVLKCRGRGYSFKAGCMLQRNYFLYPGSKSYAFAAESEYLDSDGVLNKSDDNFAFVNEHCGFGKKLALKDTLMHRKAGYKKPGDVTEYGTKSERIGVTLKNNPEKSRGKRGKLIIWEESGSFRNLIKSWVIADSSLAQGGMVHGFQVAFGTGGEEGANFEGLSRLFYGPKGFKVYSVKNVYDKSSEKNKCALFVPEYLNRSNCYDKDGNSDVIKALAEIITERIDIKYNSNDSTHLIQHKAEHPITPVEAMMRTQGNEFPAQELQTHLSNILPTKETFLKEHYVIDIFWTGRDSVDWKPIFDRQPIRDFPYRGREIIGAIEVFELPQKTKGSGQVPWGRYIIGVDTIDDDTLKTIGISLFNVWVFDLWSDVFVAEWTGRYPKASDCYAMALKMALMYNAEILYENKLKGMFEYFNRKNKLKYLMQTPTILKDMEYIKESNMIGNKTYGSPATVQINSWARRQQAEWMLTPIQSREVEDVDKDGLPIKKQTLGYQTLRSLGYIRECIQWNIDGNFDRVSGANMVFIARADKYKMVQSTKYETYEEDPYENDDFFKNNYKSSSIGHVSTFDF